MDEITKELLDALKPFAAFFDAVEHMGGNYPKTGAIYSVTSHIGGHRELSVEDFKQAREIIAKAEAALVTPQPSADGWIPWEGGDCPVETNGHDLFLRFRDGREHSDYVTRARGYDWKWERRGHPADIIAYRVVKP